MRYVVLGALLLCGCETDNDPAVIREFVERDSIPGTDLGDASATEDDAGEPDSILGESGPDPGDSGDGEADEGRNDGLDASDSGGEDEGPGEPDADAADDAPVVPDGMACAPGQSRCISDLLPAFCSEDGSQWMVDEDCAHGCVDGACCVPSCEDRPCGTDGCLGSCGPPEDCPDDYECTPGDTRCDGPVLETCGDDGLWGPGEICGEGCNADVGRCCQCEAGASWCSHQDQGGWFFATCEESCLSDTSTQCPAGCSEEGCD